MMDYDWRNWIRRTDSLRKFYFRDNRPQINRQQYACFKRIISFIVDCSLAKHQQILENDAAIDIPIIIATALLRNTYSDIQQKVGMQNWNGLSIMRQYKKLSTTEEMGEEITIWKIQLKITDMIKKLSIASSSR